MTLSRELDRAASPSRPDFGTAPIYLDNQASTPLDPRVIRTVTQAMTELFGNGNNRTHGFGEAAGAAVDDARRAAADLVGARPDEVRLVSGSTEAARLGVRIAKAKAGNRMLRIAASRVEHDAVIEPISRLVAAGEATVAWIDVDAGARLPLPALERALDRGIDLVCVMAANNEVGTIYPIDAIARLVHEAGAELLVDATQAAGRVPVDAEALGLDYVVFNAHKMYGPKGIGAFVGKDLDPWLFDEVAGHAGTPNAPAAAGFAKACRIMRAEGPDDERRIAALRDRMEAILVDRLPGLAVNGDRSARLTHNLHVSFPGTANDAVVARLRGRVAISTGSACRVGAQEPSHVLRAMRLSEEAIDGALRISPGRFTTEEEAERGAVTIAEAVRGAAGAAGGWRR